MENAIESVRRGAVVKIIKRDWKETNPHVNPWLNSNGGGYSQPEINIDLEINRIPVHLMYRNSSCGDFGSRERIEITTGKSRWSFYYGSMSNMDCIYITQYRDDLENLNEHTKHVCEDFLKTFNIDIVDLYYSLSHTN